jgi:hypothetical protein
MSISEKRRRRREVKTLLGTYLSWALNVTNEEIPGTIHLSVETCQHL